MEVVLLHDGQVDKTAWMLPTLCLTPTAWLPAPLNREANGEQMPHTYTGDGADMSGRTRPLLP